MTELIKEQIITSASMIACGFSAGLVYYILNLFEHRIFEKAKWSEPIICAISTILISYLIGEYLYFSQNGKVTFYGSILFFVGLWLWYKYFCVIISGRSKE